MPKSKLSDWSLQEWLEHIGSVHLTEIELGLDRVSAVASKLELVKPAAKVITVAGTNGKGSIVACLEQGLVQMGRSVGSYTSPHIERYNERIRINGEAISDADLCLAFQHIELAREDISLSYFEFSTLAGLWIFRQHQVEVAVLEVGLGGRLDAVNLVDPDLVIITSIALDHQEWLGNDRESIAVEKAGVLRQGIPFVCGDSDPPQSLLAKSAELQCQNFQFGEDFGLIQQEPGNTIWHLTTPGGDRAEVTTSQSSVLLPCNVASAMQALLLVCDPTELNPLAATLVQTSLAGRQEARIDARTGRDVLLDVAHNPAAMGQLARHIQGRKQTPGISGKIVVVLAVMADKDIQDMASCLASTTDIWYIAQVNVPRCMPAKEAAEQIQKCGAEKPVNLFGSMEQAYKAACEDTQAEDLIVVTGSFYTVGAVRAMTESGNSN